MNTDNKIVGTLLFGWMMADMGMRYAVLEVRLAADKKLAAKFKEAVQEMTDLGNAGNNARAMVPQLPWALVSDTDKENTKTLKAPLITFGPRHGGTDAVLQSLLDGYQKHEFNLPER